MAGLFGFFDFTKPGPGIPKDAPPKPRLIVFFEIYTRKFWKLVTLNLIYSVACLPVLAAGIINILAIAEGLVKLSDALFIMVMGYVINLVTIGPATAGFTYVLRNFSREEHAWVWSDFKEHALKNYKQAFIISIIDLIVAIVMYVNFRFYSQMASVNEIYGALRFFVFVILIIYIIMHFYIYPLLVTFKLSVKQIFRNSFIFAMVKLPQNLGILLICAILLFVCYFYYLLGILLTPLIVFSTIGLIINFSVYPTIKKYMIDKVAKITKIDSEQ